MQEIYYTKLQAISCFSPKVIKQSKSRFGTKVRYKCQFGKQFQADTGVVTNMDLECQWDGKWKPSAKLPECVCPYLAIRGKKQRI